MLFQRLFLPFLFLTLIVLPACQTARQFYESGRYDEAIDYCVDRLRGKKNKKTELVQGLEAAFAKAQDRDLRLAESLMQEGHAENWPRIHNLYRQIGDRQRKVRPLLPLVSKDGHRAHFDLIDVSRLEHDSRKNAADFLYTQAESLLERAAGQHDRNAAREAHRKLRELENRYFKVYREKDRLLEEARRLGTTWVVVELDNPGRHQLPGRLEEELMAMNKGRLDDEWISFTFDAEQKSHADFAVQVRIEGLDVSPERISERRYTDAKVIQDGWDYVLDERGNVRKDTAGNDLKTPRMVTICADVLEVFQSKAARLDASVVVLDARGSRLDTRRLSEEVRFEHYASTFIGDPRALSDDSRCRIGSAPLPFPSGESMLLDAACRLRGEMERVIGRSKVIW
ncbi:MAG: hypothetical protein SFV52_07305 [Saprospiraceae bacterium]|nr:hypothetical protein [Saprospiraceae bacterium]